MTLFYTKLLNQLKINFNADLSWLLMKLPYAFIWSVMMYIMIGDCNNCPYPVGICKMYSFSILFTPTGKLFLCGGIAILISLYLLEIKMLYTTFLLFLVSCIVMSYHESNGLFARANVFSVVWFAQFGAYSQHHFHPDFDIRTWRVQYSVQAVAATYSLAGIAKLWASGIEWIHAGPLFAIQILKNYSFLYFDTGCVSFIKKGKCIADYLMQHQALTTFMLALSLLLETFCLVAILNRKLKIVFAIGLWLMHIGIALVLGIGISAIAFPMLIFFINPFLLLVYILKRIHGLINI